MVTNISIILSPDEENNSKAVENSIFTALHLKKINATKENIIYVLKKRSVDARHGTIKIYKRYTIYINEKPSDIKTTSVPQWKKISKSAPQVAIIGAGPAGLFGALRLLEAGIKPIIIERGTTTSQRKKDIAAISTKNEIDANSNYCFGEGGAGTFSDGKLYTRSNKRGNIGKILQILISFGADSKISTDAHPHIGTDKLPVIITAIKEKIKDLGGEFYFNTQCTNLILENNILKKIKCINTKTSEEVIFSADAFLLATGHSAIDIYKMIAASNPNALTAKTFAAGVRIEHPRTLIDSIQYHNKEEAQKLGAAEYRLTTQVGSRGVYSFCMCPGGFVVPSATSSDGIVVNGMSASKRNSNWSNAAIVVEIQPEDIPKKYKLIAEQQGCQALAGLFFRTAIEQNAKLNSIGQAAPAQLLPDFLSHTKSKSIPVSSYTPGLSSSRLDEWLPEHISKRLEKAFPDFEKKMHGFITQEAVLIAPETRTSTPVRILRNKDTYESTVIKNLYPAGEGSGYAGGIVSSAMDGENCCSELCKKLL